MQTTGRKNIHVPLSRTLHEGLKEQAERLGLPATTIARAAIEEWVSKAKKTQVEEELRGYVAAMAGTEGDLDKAFEEAGIETWLRRG